MAVFFLRSRMIAPCGHSLLLLVALVPWEAKAGQRRATAEPVAISFPRDGDMVRGLVPVFGTAWWEGFRRFRVEFGEGRQPKQWHVLRVSETPVRSDPWAAGKVRWDPDRGATGNLANWDTGLTSYRYGYEPGKRNLIGVFTLRVVVENQKGEAFEKRAVVQVARIIGRQMGGIAESSDGKVFLNVQPESTVRDGVLVGIEPVHPVANPPMVELPPAKGLEQAGSIYEFRPPGLKFVKPVSFRMHYADADLQPEAEGAKPLPEQRLGIYACDVALGACERETCAGFHNVRTGAPAESDSARSRLGC